ncbi:hypothetical protein SERLADRAFT_452131 [Serpula lacrymans var. lacrymans S7.9]|uniref:Adenylyl cyclase-associated protein n=1 Tax=Serpula lacrymans var. lacrymans (strain S7.9) TaxID=578457 RepID=F8P6C2_SERL9|nr:uncharacterized protein SERLADRAFT_452131 [Serpula lacrymans var. lacrymans S7.9]EGO20989.1 hypothetical protein SERLADRAFT_452131 [Serpula lacrymans var. lacrymans S7.9]
MYSLSTIIKRLEAVTSRLEDIAQEEGAIHGRQPSPESSRNGDSSASAVAPPAPPAPPPPPPPPPVEAVEIPRSVAAYDEIVLEGKLKPFVELTKGFAPQFVNDQVSLFSKELQDLRQLLLIATACKKPDQTAFGTLLKPLQEGIEAVTRAKEAGRKEREWFTHLTVIAEGAVCVGWVTVEPKPGPYVSEIKDSTMFYGNRVLKEFKDKDAKHVEWVRAYMAILEEMKRYIMEYHTTGLVWNPKGIAVSDYRAPSASTSAPPPPPPPPPPPAAAPAAAPGGGIAGVFAELNRGEDVTKGLRKVDRSQMTHKNPELRASGVVPAGPASPSNTPHKKPIKPMKPQALMGKKPSKFALEGNKWIIEYQENESALKVADGEINQTVNLFGCKNITIIVKGKVNAITLVNCTKTQILVESVISYVSVTKSPSFTLQITGSAPTIQIDSTDSGQIYLSKDCLGVEITTAKCSAINVSLPVEGEEDGVFEEQAVPEMLKTVVQEGKLVTSVVEHVG